jgi:hypothetical protein
MRRLLSPAKDPMRKVLLLVLSTLSVLALFACGGGKSNEDEIAAAVEVVFTSGNPTSCRKLTKLAFLEQTQHTQRADAPSNCEEDAKETEDDPRQVDVSNVEVAGSKARADVSFHGGAFDGQTLELALIEEQGDWKLAKIIGFAEFNRVRLAEALRRGLRIGAGAFSPDLASCIGGVYGELARPELEELAIGRSTLPVEEILVDCQR